MLQMKTTQVYAIFELSDPLIYNWDWIERDIREHMIESDDEVNYLRINQINNHLYICATFYPAWDGDFVSLIKNYLTDLADELESQIIYLNLRSDEIIQK